MMHAICTHLNALNIVFAAKASPKYCYSQHTVRNGSKHF